MKLLQLSLRDSFWLVLVVAVALGAYRWGAEVGFETGKRELDRSRMSVRTYPVSFVTNDDDSAELIGWIKSTINIDRWSLDETAGNGPSVQYFEPNKSLVVAAYGDTHEEVGHFLKTISRLDRNANRQGKSWRDLMPDRKALAHARESIPAAEGSQKSRKPGDSSIP